MLLAYGHEGRPRNEQKTWRELRENKLLEKMIGTRRDHSKNGVNFHFGFQRDNERTHSCLAAWFRELNLSARAKSVAGTKPQGKKMNPDKCTTSDFGHGKSIHPINPSMKYQPVLRLWPDIRHLQDTPWSLMEVQHPSSAHYLFSRSR